MKRRSLLLLGSSAAGALVVGWGVLPPRSRLGHPDAPVPEQGPVALNGWLRVEPEGTVLLAMHRAEMGQGIHTALAMLVADELDIPLAKVRLEEARADSIYTNVAGFVASVPFHPRNTEPGRETDTVKIGRWIVAKTVREIGVNITTGSSSVADSWDVLRLAAATARAQLLGAASLHWKLPLAELSIADGVVSHPAAARSAHFGELARLAAATPVGRAVPKPRSAWKLIGRAAQRSDIPAKTDGRAIFGLDVRQPGQRVAVVRHCPVLGGAPGVIRNIDEVVRRPGIDRVVRLGPYAGATGAVAVVGRSYWHAKQAVQALDIEWRAPPAGVPDSRRIAESLERAAHRAVAIGDGHIFHAEGDPDAADAAAARRIEAVYHAPYLAHAAMEPLNCTARVADGKVELWLPTQAPDSARAQAAHVAGVPLHAVTLHTTLLGGGFGRRLETDVVAQAVRIAIEMGGQPVQLIWPREEDSTHDFYRPASAAVMQASLDATGHVTGLRIAVASDAIGPRWLERNRPELAAAMETLPDEPSGQGMFDLPYAIANQLIAHVPTHSGVPVGFWRSVGHSHNAFFAETFIDELAFEAKQDPVAFRLSLLPDMPRYAAVLKLAAANAGWGQPLPAGRARGVALHASFGSVVAQVAEVSIDAEGKPRVHRVVCAADVGTVVNPGIVAQQMEGAVVFGLSAALHGRIDIVGGVVQQTNFFNMPLLKLAETPRIETYLVESSNPPTGAGEPGTPPIAPAVANALFVLTGKRVRALPIVLT